VTRTRLARRKSFSCLHRYAVKDWSDAKNREIFGACFTPHGHGHNYELEVYFEGAVDPQTGMIVNLQDVDRALDRALAEIDGKHLAFEVEAFKDKNPTTENLALYLVEQIRREASAWQNVSLSRLRLYEYEDLWVDVWPNP
jgi:6-pyruvoyltetrahydropterin/6-carboxytetrahydropterin synthase